MLASSHFLQPKIAGHPTMRVLGPRAPTPSVIQSLLGRFVPQETHLRISPSHRKGLRPASGKKSHGPALDACGCRDTHPKPEGLSTRETDIDEEQLLGTLCLSKVIGGKPLGPQFGPASDICGLDRNWSLPPAKYPYGALLVLDLGMWRRQRPGREAEALD